MDDQGQGTLKRTKKKSYNWMKHIIETNGAALEGMVINSLFFFLYPFSYNDKVTTKRLWSS